LHTDHPVRRTRRAVLAALILAACLGAAAGCAKPAQAPPPPPTYKGTLTLWAAPGLAGTPMTKPDGAWFQEQAKAFTAANPDVTVDVRLFDTAEALEAAAGTPDVSFGRPQPAKAAQLADISPVLGDKAAADYQTGALDAFRAQGKLTGLPALQEVPVLALNEQAFAAAGVELPANGKWTDAEFDNTLQRLSGNGRFGLGFYQLPGYHEWWPLVGGLLNPDGTLASGAEAGFERLARYRQSGLLHPDTAKLKAEETWALFARGEFAVMPVPGWAVPTLRDAYQLKLSVAGFPGDATVGYTYGFMIGQQTEPLKFQAAVALARFLGSAGNLTVLARQTGLVPALKTAENPFPGDPAMSRLYALAATQRTLPVTDEVPLHRELTLALLGARDPKAAVAALQSAIAPASK
jgi:ABC-type glycerol-3-phosphate transport system substrate-binding protein